MIFGFQLFIPVTLMIENLKQWGFHMDLQFITDFRQKKTCHKICLEIRKPSGAAATTMSSEEVVDAPVVVIRQDAGKDECLVIKIRFK